MSQLLITIILILSCSSFCMSQEGETSSEVLNKVNLKVYYNSTLPYGARTPIAITVQVLPDDAVITVRLSTRSYLLVYCNIGNVKNNTRTLQFTETDSISKRLAHFNIQSNNKVSYENGSFSGVWATFWNIEDKNMTLLLSVPSSPLVQEYNEIYQINVDQSNCELRLRMLRCSDPNSAQHITIARGLAVQAVFLKSSNISIKTKFRWTVMDLMGTTKHMEKYTDYSVLYLDRYTLGFRTKYELWRDQLMVYVRGNYDGQSFGARCYLIIERGQVEAIIGGGSQREVSYFSELVMNGNTSRDYSKSPDSIQFSKYYWNCECRDDDFNNACVKNISNMAIFKIAPYSFKPNENYIFRLLVEDEVYPSRASYKLQTVSIVAYPTLQVMIVCVFNCAMDMFSPTSMVRLKAVCLDCDESEVTYKWYVSNQLTITNKNLTMYINTVEETADIRLTMQTASGLLGEQTKYLKKNRGPKIGQCTVEPTTGIEALTSFYPCCKNFDSSFSPVEYWFYADGVVLNSCYDCTCVVHLPVVSEIKVLICDIFLACCSTSISVQVEPLKNIPVEAPGDVWNYIISEPHNILKLVSELYDIRYLQAIQSTASRIRIVESANELLKALEGSRTCTRVSLGKLANLTLTFANRFKPINPQAHLMLTKVLTILNNNFACMRFHNMEIMLVEEPFINVTKGCMTVYDIMKRLSNQAPRPPKSIYFQYYNALENGTLNQDTVDRLMEQINKFSDKDAKFYSCVWLKSMWQTERLYRFLGFARSYGLQPDDNDVDSEYVVMELQCFNIEIGKTYIIQTRDRMHKVRFSPELLQELKEKEDNYICLKVISIIRRLNWWYPEEKQPSAVLLSVHIYHTVDNFKVEVPLRRSRINFTTAIGKYKPVIIFKDKTKNKFLDLPDVDLPDVDLPDDDSPNSDLPETRFENQYIDNPDDPEEQISDGHYIRALKRGKLNYMQDVLMYRIALEELTMLAVRFTKSSHKLHVKLTMEQPPLFSEVSASTCSVPGNTTSKTLLIRNNCNVVKRAYMAIRVWGKSPPPPGTKTPVHMGPAEFSFLFQVRSCDHWVYSKNEDEQHWGHTGCIPSMIVNVTSGMRCSCDVISTYTSYVFTAPAITVLVDPFKHVEMNTYIILFYAFIFAALLLWLLWLFLYSSIPPSKTTVCEMSDTEGRSRRDVHDLLVELKTGGRDNAGTTASVKLSFFTTQRQELQFTIMQDPEHPVLLRNTTYILWLRTRDIRIPTKIAVSHNNNGRYPKWFLRRIEVSDVQRQETQVFVVRRWVKDKILVLTSTLIFKRGDARFVGTWFQRFRLYCEKEIANWALCQPLFGTWQETNEYPSMSRFKRACVFISKMVIVYTIVACYLGPTTVETLQRDRTAGLTFNDWLFLSVICYLVGMVVQLFFDWMIHHYS